MASAACRAVWRSRAHHLELEGGVELFREFEMPLSDLLELGLELLWRNLLLLKNGEHGLDSSFGNARPFAETRPKKRLTIA